MLPTRQNSDRSSLSSVTEPDDKQSNHDRNSSGGLCLADERGAVIARRFSRIGADNRK
jgi:hypothetical protein